MGQMIGKEYIPGPNDHHIEIVTVDGKEVPSLAPGLGTDEPTPDKQKAARLAGKEELEQLHEEIKAEAAELEGKAEELSTRESEIERAAADLDSKAQALAERERVLAEREAKLVSGDPQ